jgi:hypothetical protein
MAIHRVFIFGPVATANKTSGSCVHHACIEANKLLRRGIAVYLQHWNWMTDIVNTVPPECWSVNDTVWVDVCDAVLCLGICKASVQLEFYAEKKNIPIFKTAEEIINASKEEP